MSRKLALRLMVLGLAFALFVVLAPAAGANGPIGAYPSGPLNVTFFNYVSDEGGSYCPSGGNIYVGTEGVQNIFHYWPEYTSPYPGVGINNYTVCWEGYLNFPQSGTWYVQTINDDGMDIWVDDNITMQAWYDQGPTLHQGSAYVDASFAHHVVIKYYNRGLGGTACVAWGLNGQPVGIWACPQPPFAVADVTVSVPPVYCANIPYQSGQFPCNQYAFNQYPYNQNQNFQPQYVQNGYNPLPYGQCPSGYNWMNNFCQPVYVAPTPPPQVFGMPYPRPNPFPVKPRDFGQVCAYVVQPGDSLASIAARYGLSIQALAQYNGLNNPNRINSGIALHIPKCR